MFINKLIWSQLMLEAIEIRIFSKNVLCLSLKRPPNYKLGISQTVGQETSKNFAA